MANISFTDWMADQILGKTDHATRFERFCAELFTMVDGVEYVPTSESWDLGRDARPGQLIPIEDQSFIACSLRPDVPEKALADLERLLESGPVKALRFCSSQRLSEHAREGIKAALLAKCPDLKDVAIDGATQIVTLLIRDPQYAKAFERFYHTELDAVRRALAAPLAQDDTAAIAGMRLALTTQLNQYGEELRESVIRHLLLTVLQDRQPKTKSLIAKRASELLHLNRTLNDHYLQPNLDHLRDGGLITSSDQTYQISDLGLAELKALSSASTSVILEGQKLVRKEIVKLTGHDISDAEFSDVWRVLQDEFAEMFYANGMQIIDAIASIASNDVGIKDYKEVSEMIQGIGRKVERQLLNSPIGQAVGQALIDIFHDRYSPAYEWFTNLCASYVTICSLGLDPQAQRAIYDRLKNIDLLLDTDIVLTFLCEGEPQHEAVAAVLRGWRGLGGSVSVATPVLEEAAYHAHISEREFENVFHQMLKYTESEANWYIMNAFVRGYWAVSRKKRVNPSLKTWRQYILNYRGQNERDYSLIWAELEAAGFHHLSDEKVDKAVAREIASQFIDYQSKEDRPRPKLPTMQQIDKSDRDGRLVALLVQHRRGLHGVGKTAALVSSATTMRYICRARPDLRGVGEAVMPLEAIAYLLTFVPGAHVSAKSLKKLMFNPTQTERLSPMQRIALRVLYSSTEFSLPFSRRGQLQREMYSKMSQIATQRGQSVQDLQAEIVQKGDERDELLTEIVHDAIDQISLSASEKRIRELEVKLKQAEDELARARRKGGQKG